MVSPSKRDTRQVIDERILCLVRVGRVSDAADVLARAYGPEIVGTCISRMGQAAAGQDAAQDALARALVALPNYRGTAGLRPWLHRIAANRCIDLMRSQGTRRNRTVDNYELEMLQAPREPLPHEVHVEKRERAERLRSVRAVLNSIKEPDRTWVELHYTHDVSYDDIAADSGLSRAAVKQRIWRAVKRVRTAMLRQQER